MQTTFRSAGAGSRQSCSEALRPVATVRVLEELWVQLLNGLFAPSEKPTSMPTSASKKQRLGNGFHLAGTVPPMLAFCAVIIEAFKR